jgi:hypothetical protein
MSRDDANSSGERRQMDRAVARLDGWRRPLAEGASSAGSFKEWMHFCVRLPGESPGHLLINLNVTERRLVRTVQRTPRLIVLCDAGHWTGEMREFAPEDVHGSPGRVDVSMGPNVLRWKNGAYELDIVTPRIQAVLKIVPLVLPTVTSSVSFGPGHAMHWVVVPRLEADGYLIADGTRIELSRASTYHDHNWGHFRWGEDLSWEWGFVNPTAAECPWSVVFVRVSDGLRHTTLSQGTLLWKNDVNVRTFQNGEIAVRLEGTHDERRPFTLPPIASLLVPGSSSGVPRALKLKAEGNEEHLILDYDVASGCRIGVPSDVDDFRTVLLNETSGPARVRGVTRAGSFDFAGPAIVEFVRG